MSEIGEAIRQIMSSGHMRGFDDFIIEQMGGKLSGVREQDEEIRKKAYKEFRHRCKNYEFASQPTMRHWFGIGGMSKPSRQSVYEMGLVMGLDRGQMENYLKQGLCEPSFQLNDYREIIWLYGLENGMSVLGCEQMIHLFEEYMVSIGEKAEWLTHSTKELWKQFERVKGKSQEEFYLWMIDHAAWFRGYSKTTQEYLLKLRKSILAEMKKEAKERLELLLGETDYDRWKKMRKGKEQDEKEMIHRFLRYGHAGKNPIEPNLLQTIRELYHLAYREWDSNTQLLSELYNNHESAKHLSDLYNIPVMREREWQLLCCLGTLETMQDDEECPEKIRQWGIDLTRQEESFDTVGNAKKTLDTFRREFKRRNLLVQRSDLFPMVLQVSQNQYRKKYQDKYDQETAKEMFVDMAEKVANACNMLPLSEEYAQDMLLLSCFQEKEMYSYAEALDELAAYEESGGMDS